MIGGNKQGVKDSQMKQKQQIQEYIQIDAARWYYQIYRNRNKYHRPPSSVPQYKQSHPYRLVISKIQGFTLNKKNATADLFLRLSGMLFTQQFHIIGAPFYYQFESSLGRSESKWEQPVALYFHSKIDKNYEGLYLIIRLSVLEIKSSFTEDCADIGVIIIKNPLTEQSSKTLPLFRDVNQIEFGFSPPETKSKILSGSSPISAEYFSQSMLELKKLTKLIPQNAIFTHQDHVTGIRGDYLSKQIEDLQITDARSVVISVSYLQVHLSQRFEQDILSHLKKIYSNEKTIDIKNRKIVLGYHNEHVLVNSSARKLELIDKEVAGNSKIYIFEGLKEGQIIKVPFYYENQSSLGMLLLGLVYQIGFKEVQLACCYFLPVDGGEEINQPMIMGQVLGATSQLISFVTNQVPTIILQYGCNIKQFQGSVRDDGFSSAKEFKGSGPINEQLLAEERERLKKQIEKEKIELLKQKEEMEKLKLEKDIHYQVEFEKKFAIQKENLYKRQQMIQNQYKEQVQRQIREKFQLEEEVKKMVERIKNLEDHSLKKAMGEESYRSSKPDHFEMSEKVESPQQQSANMPPIRQRMDPGYVIEPENTVPVKKIRQIIEKTGKVSSEIVKQSELAFNFASKFTFTFTSIIWSDHIEIPKSIYFLIRFFNQRQLRTENLGYLEGQGGYYQIIKLGHYNRGFESKDASYSFTIDPSEYHQPALLQKDLTQYLQNNNSIIDIFCGETHLYIGQMNVKLRDLIRGNRNQSLIAKEVNLVKIKNKQVLGILQILIKNEQMSCRQEVSIKHEKRSKEVKKKIVSNNPLYISQQRNIHKEEKQIEQIRNKNLSLNRQELRIQKYKQQKSNNTFASAANNFAHLDELQKGFVLEKIASYKEKKIQDFLKGAYENLLNQKIIVSAHYGKAVTFPFLFTNTSQTPSSYKISIMGVENQSAKELSVVKSNKQWRYLVNKQNYQEPKRYDVIGENNSFFLQPGETIPLVFKFLSFEAHQVKVGQFYSKQKLMNVTICKQDNNWIAGGFSLLVNLHEQIIHHSYVLYEPGEQFVDLIVPVIYSETQNSANTKKLYLTNQDQNANAIWLNPYEILIRIPTPKIMQKLRFNLLLYEDQYFCELTENWLIEVYAYEGVCTTFRSDFNTRFKITLPWSAVPAHLGLLNLDRAASCLNLYASNSGLIFKDNIIEIESDRRDQGSYQIWCELIGNENTLKNFEITCVSGDENELIYGWAVTVYPYLPRG